MMTQASLCAWHLFNISDIWIFGYLDIWIFGYLDIWIFRYLDILYIFSELQKISACFETGFCQSLILGLPGNLQ
jgi:hypothetical protein